MAGLKYSFRAIYSEKWITHTQKWHESIEEYHGSPSGHSTKPRFFGGTDLKPMDEIIKEDIMKIFDYLNKHI